MKTTSALTGKTVVVIDDDTLVLEATGGLLRSWGLRVLPAQCYDEALTEAAKSGRRPDLIVCDYRLPRGENGIEAIEGLRSAFEIPALLISGDSNCPPCNPIHDRYQLLHKPLEAEALRAALLDSLRHL